MQAMGNVENKTHVWGSIGSDPPLRVEFIGLRGNRGGGPLDPAGTTGVAGLLMSPTKGEPLRPVRDPSSAAGRVMGGDIPLLSLEETTAAAALSSLSAQAPRWLIRGNCSPEELLCCKSLGLSSCFMVAVLLQISAADLLVGCCCSHGGLTLDNRGGCIDKRRSSRDGTISSYFCTFCWSKRGICNDNGQQSWLLDQGKCNSIAMQLHQWGFRHKRRSADRQKFPVH